MSRVLLIALLVLVTGTAVADCAKCDDTLGACTAKCLDLPESQRFACGKACGDAYERCLKANGCT
ncbi:MAG: hypothetical protein E6Q93_27175 [Burkholderiaceae bacterium]|jgi:hypothetical protein|nr:MAG: hypothetical protein E6Q93_27175 [Burkholderiaceae bacterium]